MARFLRISKDTIINVDRLEKLSHVIVRHHDGKEEEQFRYYTGGDFFLLTEETFTAISLFLNPESIVQ